MLLPVFENEHNRSLLSVALTVNRYGLSGALIKVLPLPAATVTTPPLDWRYCAALVTAEL